MGFVNGDGVRVGPVVTGHRQREDGTGPLSAPVEPAAPGRGEDDLSVGQLARREIVAVAFCELDGVGPVGVHAPDMLILMPPGGGEGPFIGCGFGGAEGEEDRPAVVGDRGVKETAAGEIRSEAADVHRFARFVENEDAAAGPC